jgi:hypothetical protein
MLRARAGGELLRSEADYQLHVLYLWYENEPEQALQLLAGLRARHPRNPHFLQRIAEVEDEYLHDPYASRRSYESLLAAAGSGRVNEAPLASAMARLGLARQLDRVFETDAALPHLRAVIEDDTAPDSAVAEAHRLHRQMTERLAAPAYRLSIEGWRALERGNLAQAARALTQSLALDRDDPVTQYRQARLLFAQHRDEDALIVLAEIHKRHATTPATIYARACVDAARVKAQQGDLAGAIDLYRSATTVFGGDRRVKDEAQRELARLTAAAR